MSMSGAKPSLRVYTFSFGSVPFTVDLLNDGKALGTYFAESSKGFKELAKVPQGAVFHTSFEEIRQKNTFIRDDSPEPPNDSKESAAAKPQSNPVYYPCILECEIPLEQLSRIEFSWSNGARLAGEGRFFPKLPEADKVYWSQKGIDVTDAQITRIFPIVSLTSFGETHHEVVKSAMLYGISKKGEIRAPNDWSIVVASPKGVGSL